jgi:hypothetical protein
MFLLIWIRAMIYLDPRNDMKCQKLALSLNGNARLEFCGFIVPTLSSLDR